MKPPATAKARRRRAHRKAKTGAKVRLTAIFDPREQVKNRRAAP